MSAIAFFIFLLTAPSLYAQTVSGTISGTITDASGASVSNAVVSVKSSDTSLIRNGATNETGYFSFPALPPGAYEVNVSLEGFQPATSSVKLSVGQVLNVNFQLKVGNTTEKVVVVASESTGLQTATHELSTVLQGKSMEELPQYSGSRGETFASQTMMVGVQLLEPPGEQINGSNVTSYNTWSNALLIGGQGSYVTTYLQDGVVDMDYFNQTATVQPPVEATAEVQVIRNNPNARYDGVNVVNVVSKSGTEKFHGRAYENVQNEDLNATTYQNGPNSEDRYNLFGINGGGVVPYTHKKVFFFADYQGYRLNIYKFLKALLPTQAERNGDFSADLAANGSWKGEAATTIYDPLTYASNGNNGTGKLGYGSTAVLSQFAYNGQPNVINPARISSFAKAYMNLIYPYPNSYSANGKNYGSTHSRTQFTHDDYLFRGDYNLSDRDHLYGAYNTGNPKIIRPEFVDDCLCAEPNKLYGTDIYVEESHVVTANFVNTARLGYARAITGKDFGNVGNGTNYFANFGLTGLTPARDAWSWINAIPGGFSGPSGNPLDAVENSFQLSDEINWIHGKHSVFFGIELDKRYYKGRWVSGNPNGSLATNGQYTYDSGADAAWNRNTGLLAGSLGTKYAANAFADFLLGYYSGTGASAGTQIGWFTQYNTMPYIQDDWRLSKKLTVNLGLRYDNYTTPKEKNNHAGIFDIVTNTYKHGLYPANKYNFSPRLGLAYSLDDKTSIHAGFGLYYYQFGYIDLSYVMNDPYFITQLNSTQTQAEPVIWPTTATTSSNPNITLTATQRGYAEQFQLGDAESVWANMPAPSGIFPVGGTTFAPKMPTSYAEQWNLAIQRVIGKDWLLTLNYAGSENHHGIFISNPNLASLPSAADIASGAYSTTANVNSRRPYPSYAGDLYQFSKWNSSNYHAFETQLRKSFSDGFEFTTNFTWQKGMDYQSSDYTYGQAGRRPQDDYGPSEFIQKLLYKASGIYDLPFGKGKTFLNGGKWWENEIGGWRLSGDFYVETGFPFTAIATNEASIGGGYNERANMLCNGNKSSHGSTADQYAQYLNFACFAQPTAGTLGNERRDDLIGPRNTNVDLSLFKEFLIHDDVKFQLRGDAFNAFNHVNLGEPTKELDASDFGAANADDGNTAPGRTIQIGAKILW
ncbi:MAG: TonB-dependent receptor [Terracidiphilus sp.]|nr:TonB-dependent receptor [Terracidiphilus sp.]